MLGYPVITAYYQISVRLSLTLPSAPFIQLLTKLTLPQLMDRSISAHEGLKPCTLTSCPAHIIQLNFSPYKLCLYLASEHFYGFFLAHQALYLDADLLPNSCRVPLEIQSSVRVSEFQFLQSFPKRNLVLGETTRNPKAAW